MPQVSDMIQSKYLKKEDFNVPKVFTIKGCSLEEVGQGDQRWVLWLNEAAKGLVLNATKIHQLEHAYGGHSDNWLNQKVRLSHDPNVTFAGKIVGGIKLETPRAVQPTPPPPQDDEFDDNIPF